MMTREKVEGLLLNYMLSSEYAVAIADDVMDEVIVPLIAELDAARTALTALHAENARLRAALDEYGQHHARVSSEETQEARP